ncbi:hypothetical protein EBZ38_13275 [bacterium]|nr:hypothetical protein [bacterium]
MRVKNHTKGKAFIIQVYSNGVSFRDSDDSHENTLLFTSFYELTRHLESILESNKRAEELQEIESYARENAGYSECPF